MAAIGGATIACNERRSYSRLVGLGPVGVHRVHPELEHLDLAAVGLGSELDDGVQRHVQVGQLLPVLVVEVGEDAAEHRLVRDHQHVRLALQLHYHRLEAGHQVL